MKETKPPENLQAEFSHLILSIASASLMKMGLDVAGSKEEKNLELAKYNLDLLTILKEKTQSNLSQKEDELLNSCIKDLQLKFIQSQK